MQIEKKINTESCDEAEIYNSLFDLSDKYILELGCGSATITRAIAEANPGCRIDALEIDEIQHNKNLLIDDLPNVSFRLAVAQDIPAEDGRYDIVFMFKSLHHVPPELMETALQEIQRVLKPGGKAYISEPVYDGDFNDLIKLFHDEKAVREAAFASIKKAVEGGIFSLKDEMFFNTEVCFADFAEFEQRVIGASFAEHRLDAGLLQQVRATFALNQTRDGARFTVPVRVDLLVKG